MSRFLRSQPPQPKFIEPTVVGAPQINFVSHWDIRGANQTTINISPSRVGNLLVFTVNINDDTVAVTGITGGGVDVWEKIGSDFGDQPGRIDELWVGVVSQIGAQTVTVAYTSATPTEELTVNEFNGPGFQWRVSAFDHSFTASAVQFAWANLTAPNDASSAHAYFGYAGIGNVTDGTGETAGFTYGLTAFNNPYVYETGLTPGASYQPTMNQTLASYARTVAVIISSGGTAPPVEVTTAWRARRLTQGQRALPQGFAASGPREPTVLAAAPVETVVAVLLTAVQRMTRQPPCFPRQGWLGVAQWVRTTMFTATDNFNRANQSPIAGSWAKMPQTTSGLAISSNAVVASVGSLQCASYFRAAAHAANVEVSAQNLGSDSFGGGDTLSIFARCNVAAALNGYELRHTGSIGSSGPIQLYRWDNGVATAIGSSVTLSLPSIAVPYLYRLRCVGSLIVGEVIGLVDPGFYTAVTATDSTYLSGGYAGLGSRETYGPWDDFTIATPYVEQWFGVVQRAIGVRPPLVIGYTPLPVKTQDAITVSVLPPLRPRTRRPHYDLYAPQVLAQPPPAVTTLSVNLLPADRFNRKHRRAVNSNLPLVLFPTTPTPLAAPISVVYAKNAPRTKRMPLQGWDFDAQFALSPTAAALGAMILSDAPVGYWPLQEASGLPKDYSGNGNDFTGTVGAGFFYQQSGSPILGDVTLQIGGGSGFTRPTPTTQTLNWTLEAVIQPQVLAHDGDAFIYLGSTGGTGWGLMVNSDGTLQPLLGGIIAGARTNTKLTTQLNLPFTNRYHVALVKRGAGTALEIWINGILDTAVQPTNTPNAPTLNLNLNNVTVGTQIAYEHVAVYNAALSSLKIQARAALVLTTGKLTSVLRRPFLGVRPPLAVVPQPLPPEVVLDTPVVVMRDQERARGRRPHYFLSGPSTFAQPPPVVTTLSITCLQPDRLARRYRRQLPQSAVGQPTVLQVFAGPTAYLARIRPRHTGSSLPLVIPTTAAPVAAVFAATLTHVRPRPTRHYLTPPQIVRVPSVEQHEQSITVALVRIRPRPQAAHVYEPTALRVFQGPTTHLTRIRPRHTTSDLPLVVAPSTTPVVTTLLTHVARTKPRPTTHELIPPATLEPESIAIQERTPRILLAHTRPRSTRHFFTAPTVVRVPSVEQLEQTVRVTIVRTRPRAKVARLTPPTTLRAFAAPTAPLVRTRPRPTRKFISAPTVVRVPQVGQHEQTISAALVRIRPRPTTHVLGEPTVLQIFTAATPTLAHIRPRRTRWSIEQPTVVRVPSVEQAEETIRTPLVHARPRPTSHFLNKPITLQVFSGVEAPFVRIRPQPTSTFLSAVSYVQTGEVSVALVRIRPRPTTRFLQEPTVLQAFAASEPTLAHIRPRPTIHRLAPPTVTRVPSVEQVEQTIRVLRVRIRPRPTQVFIREPLVKSFPPVVTMLKTVEVAVRRPTEQRRHVVEHFLRAPQKVLPLPTQRVQTIDVHRVRIRPRPTTTFLSAVTYPQRGELATAFVRIRPRLVRSELAPPSALQTFAGPISHLIRARTRPTMAEVKAPMVLRTFSGPSVALARITPKPITSLLRAPIVTSRAPVVIALTRALVEMRPRPTMSFLPGPAIARAVKSTLSITFVRNRAKPTISHLGRPLVLRSLAPTIQTHLAVSRRPFARSRISFIAAPPFVETARLHTLAQIRPPQAVALLAPPAVVAPPPPPVVTVLTVLLRTLPDRLRRRLYKPIFRVVIGPPPILVPQQGIASGHDINAFIGDGVDRGMGASGGTSAASGSGSDESAYRASGDDRPSGAGSGKP